MFDYQDVGVGLWPGEGTEVKAWLQAEDRWSYELTCRLLADGWTEPNRHVLPSGLEGIAPGVHLAAVVSSVDRSRLNGHDVVRLMQAEARMSSHHEAGKYEAMAEVAYASPSDPDSEVLRRYGQEEYAAVEVAAALTLTRRSSEEQLSRAVSITGRLRRVGEMLSRGDIDLAKVRVLDQCLGHLPAETVDSVLDQVIDDAGFLTTGQLRARLSRLVMEADPDGSKSSFEEGLAERKVGATSNPDHTANFNISSGRPQDVAAAREFVEALARSLNTRDESRTSISCAPTSPWTCCPADATTPNMPVTAAVPALSTSPSAQRPWPVCPTSPASWTVTGRWSQKSPARPSGRTSTANGCSPSPTRAGRSLPAP